MNRHVNAISGRLSLRPPQRHSLEILHRITEISPPRKATDVAAALEIIESEFPSVTDFEREFPSLCFALATGVGKTRLMGAFISYQPDFIAETSDTIYMLEPKKRKEMKDLEVLAKKEAAEKWCRNASSHSAKNGGKPWIYKLIPHDTIKANMTIDGLAG